MVHDARLVAVPTQHLAAISELVNTIGVVAATRKLKLSRTAIFGALATGQVMPGSAAIIREFFRAQRTA